MVPLLQVENLNVHFPLKRGIFARTVGHVKAVDGVSFTLAAGETLALVGESGSGKTTLARAVLRLETPTAGDILFEGASILSLRGAALKAYRCAVQAVFQDPFASLNPRFTTLELVTEAAVVQGVVPRAERRAYAIRLLEEVGLDASALERYPHAFSGGQRQRICIARALSLGPRLLICDEAVSALDLSVRAQVLELLLELKRAKKLSYLFITHDLGVVRKVADRVLVLYKGQIVEAGTCDQVLGAPQQAYTKLLLAAVPEIGGAR